MDQKRIRAVAVDDSAVFRTYLARILTPSNNIDLVKAFSNPKEALPQISVLRPDVLVVDMEMPEMRGNDFLRHVLPRNPGCKAVVISSRSENVFDAMRAGAVDFVEKPGGQMSNEEFASELLQKVRVAAAANAGAIKTRSPLPAVTPVPAAQPMALTKTNQRHVIAIGASTGGTEAILEVVRNFPQNTPGVVVVQHMPPGFTKMYADRLDKVCQMHVREAGNGDRVEQGVILIAPGGDRQMRLKRDVTGYYVRLTQEEKVSGHCPSVDVLFESVSAVGANAVGVLLTGMGADGAQGLKKMRVAGAFTFGQNEETCIVYGMPKVAYESGGVSQQLALQDIGPAVLQRLRSM